MLDAVTPLPMCTHRPLNTPAVTGATVACPRTVPSFRAGRPQGALDAWPVQGYRRVSVRRPCASSAYCTTVAPCATWIHHELGTGFGSILSTAFHASRTRPTSPQGRVASPPWPQSAPHELRRRSPVASQPTARIAWPPTARSNAGSTPSTGWNHEFAQGEPMTTGPKERIAAQRSAWVTGTL